MDNGNVATTHPPEPIAPITPPGGNLENRQPPARSANHSTRSGEINAEKLRVIQEIQSIHSAFGKLNEYEQTNLKFSLANAGLPETGAILNATA